MRPRRRHIVNLADVGREGKRYCAFYRGYQARQRGQLRNPHPWGSELHECWQAGWEYAGKEAE